jgi:hypothetical protein
MGDAMNGASLVLGFAGTLYLIQQMEGDLVMEGQHWIMLAVILVAGYVLGRLMPQLGQTVGLP